MLPLEYHQHLRVYAHLQRCQLFVIGNRLVGIRPDEKVRDDIVVVHTSVVQSCITEDVPSVDLAPSLQKQLCFIVQSLDGSSNQRRPSLLIFMVYVGTSENQESKGLYSSVAIDGNMQAVPSFFRKDVDVDRIGTLWIQEFG